ncbi:MAG TPA: energy-coupling factor transporter ATPase [Limnochordales bacterium]|nr:energy-coupling factor transporter ATPase [Limnochordales bacterium]
MPIVVKDLHYTYNAGTPWAVPALRGVSLTVGDGEFVGVIGPMGAGKSTLAQHLNGLLRPPPGTVWVDGQDVGAREGDLLAVRRRVGLVFQFPERQLFAETVAADVAFGPRNLGLAPDAAAERARVALGMVGLDYEALKDRSPFSLSGGQQRRVALAGVLAMGPRYLILDEPTAGLDPAGRRELLGLLARLHREQGLAVVLITHHLEDVVRLAQKVVVLAQGRVAMAGPPAAVLGAARRPQLRALGLDVPVAARLVDELNRRGWQLPGHVVREEEAVAAIVQAAAARRAPGRGAAEGPDPAAPGGSRPAAGGGDPGA